MSGGQDIQNTRSASSEHQISASNAGRLEVKWVFAAEGDVTATPAVDETAVYFPDGGGYLTKLDKRSGKLLQKRKISDYTGNTKSFSLIAPISRSTPAIHGNWLVIGTRDGYVLGINKADGSLVWKTRADEHPAAMITMSPTIFAGRVYVGVSSTEAALTVDPKYPCCSFRGSAIALELESGKIVWRTYSVPETYSGGPMWGGPPAIDERRRQVYFTTGQNYSLPEAVRQCILKTADPSSAAECSAPDNYFDSVLALDLDDGSIKWGKRTEAYDEWTLACGVPEYGIPAGSGCVLPQSPDYDFASGVNLMAVVVNGHGVREIVGAGQKSGVYWALDPDDGKVLWSTQVGPGGVIGGIMWGSATDGRRVYVAIANSVAKPYVLRPTGEEIKWGAWSAIDAATGRILWQTADPNHARAPGFVSTANGIVYAASFDPQGHYYAFDAETGRIVWKFPSGGSTISGAAIVDGRVYWGSGYGSQGGTASNKVYAFGLP